MVALSNMWELLPSEGRDLIRGSYLGRFIEEAATKKFVRSPDIMVALRERWWDSTHTFHFPWGEMTMTPTDFTYITGLPCEGQEIVVDPFFFRTGRDEIAPLLGEDFGFGSDEIRLDILHDHLREMAEADLDRVQLHQLMRVFLLWALGETLFCNANTSSRVSLLPFIADFDELDLYDWGSAGLATCYWGLDHVSRLATTSLTGFIHAWEVSSEP